jgi:hypothetical protein
MEKVRLILGRLPKTVIADAGYGSEENYAFLEKKEIPAVVKYGSYYKEKSKPCVVGKLENNRDFRRFLLRSIKKVTLEIGSLSLAHNVSKQAAIDQKRRTAILQ